LLRIARAEWQNGKIGDSRHSLLGLSTASVLLGGRKRTKGRSRQYITHLTTAVRGGVLHGAALGAIREAAGGALGVRAIDEAITIIVDAIRTCTRRIYALGVNQVITKGKERGNGLRSDIEDREIRRVVRGGMVTHGDPLLLRQRWLGGDHYHYAKP
jgi:hypothetical protein